MFNKKSVFLFYSLIGLVFVSGIETNTNSNYVSFPAPENGSCYKRVRYDDAIADSISQGIIKLAPGSDQTGVKSSNNRAWITVIDCCDGFVRNNETNQCETHCDEGCLGGTCTGPNICTCNDGWRPEAGICKPICRRPCPENAYCFSPDFCTCKFGYEEIEGVCRPVCLHGCRNGDCVAPRDCRCHTGYYLNETQICEPLCEGGCPYGECTSPGVCTCNRGYVNTPEDLETCVPSCPDTCKNGKCHSPNICTCDVGYTETDVGTCVAQCTDGCDNGHCVAPEQCLCDPGFSMDQKSRKCVESSKLNKTRTYDQNIGQYDNFSNNRNYGNNNYNDGVTIRPDSYDTQINSRFNAQGQAQDFNRQSNQNNDNISPTRAHGTQGIIQNRNQETVNQQNNQNNYSQDETYGFNTTPIPREPFVTHTPDTARESLLQRYNGTSNLRDSYRPSENNKTQRGQGPFPSDLPNQRPNQMQNPYDANRPYGNYDHNQTFIPHRPVNSQGPFPTQDLPSTQNSASTNDPLQVINPYDTQYPSQLENSPGPTGTNRNNPSQNTQRTNDPYGVYGSEQQYRPQRPYSTQGQNQNLDGRVTHGQQGIKTSNRRPSTGTFYGRPATNPSTPQPGIILVMHDLGETNPYSYQQTGPGIYNPDNSDNIYLSSVNPFSPVCELPCINGICIGFNQCACKDGHALDPRDPFGHKCVPVCYGGCLNGVCSGPNYCICNLGFVKEQGIKGSQRCVPAY